MKDLCYWCSQNRCRRTHGLEMAEYRTKLRMVAEKELRSKVEKYRHRSEYVSGFPWEVLVKLNPKYMTMEEHWLKGFYLQNKKTMTEREAYEKALGQLETLQKRRSYLYPTFGKEEMKKINAYRPKNKLVGKSGQNTW